MDCKLISFVLRAKNRRKVFLLLAKEKLTPSQIMKRTNMYESHTSRTLKELLSRKLIVCENPNERRFRFYKITYLGKKTAKDVEKILKEIGKV
ncbi:winged helix-turn-helix transcriptional regulator [Candidatus Woesearchaeota archaeon]|nr:winged helix-turn-helix transcriptional regulator [Candidatus Woesearchaeota archaeon]